MGNVLILQNILVLGALSSQRTFGKTSFNIGTCCNANCSRIHQVALQITWDPGVQWYPAVPRVATYIYVNNIYKDSSILYAIIYADDNTLTANLEDFSAITRNDLKRNNCN